MSRMPHHVVHETDWHGHEPGMVRVYRRTFAVTNTGYGIFATFSEAQVAWTFLIERHIDISKVCLPFSSRAS